MERWLANLQLKYVRNWVRVRNRRMIDGTLWLKRGFETTYIFPFLGSNYSVSIGNFFSARPFVCSFGLSDSSCLFAYNFSIYIDTLHSTC